MEPTPETAVHRIGGGFIENLRLKPKEMSLAPPGVSVLLGGTAQESAQQYRKAYPRSTVLLEAAKTVGSSTVEKIHQAGFVVLPKPSKQFANHARITHPDGLAGFTDDHLVKLSST